jgi:excisionase family DNA binding protein
MSDTLSPAEAQALTGYHEDTLKRWARNGKLPAIKTPGGWWRFRRSDLEALNESVIHGPAEPEPETAA